MSRFYGTLYENKKLEQILTEFEPTTQQDFLKVAIMVRATLDINSSTDKLVSATDRISNSIKENSNSANKLSLRLFWLNVLLAIITFLGVVFTAISVF